MNRRGFLASILAAGIAPYVMSSGIASGILMPVRKLWTPSVVATLDLLDFSGRVLCSISYPNANTGNQAYGIVTQTGVFHRARLSHPKFPRSVFVDGLQLNTNSLVTGSTINMFSTKITT